MVILIIKHYFDGRWHHYQGACEYVLTKICDSNEFNISAGNFGHDGTSVSCAAFLRVVFPAENFEVLIRRERSITINGVPHTCTDDNSNIFMNDYVEVYCRGGNPYVSLSRGIRVFYDGVFRIKISVSSTLRGQLCGLCGTYNGNTTDDLTASDGNLIIVPDGSFSVEIDGGVVEFGDSWLVPDDSVPGCAGSSTRKKNAPGVAGCSTDPDIISEGQTRCNVLQQDPFTACHGVVNVSQTISNCEFDYCCCNETEREDCYCQ